MTSRRWFAMALVTLLTAAGACTGQNPLGFQQDDGGRVTPPEAPTDTSGFMHP